MRKQYIITFICVNSTLVHLAIIKRSIHYISIIYNIALSIVNITRCLTQLIDGVQAVEAFLFTLEEINNDPTLLPGITLGGVALDSCNSPRIGLRQSLAFIKGISLFYILMINRQKSLCVV